MKKINLIEWLWKTDSPEKQSPQRFFRYAVMLLMLLTLGVGQMWADQAITQAYLKASFNGSAVLWDGSSDEYVYNGSGHSNFDLGTLTGDFILTYVSWKAETNWSQNTDFYLYYRTNSSASYSNVKQNWTGDGTYYPKTTSLSQKVASVTDGSGNYDFDHYFYANFGGYGGGNISYLSNGGGNYHFTYKILPPAVSGFTVTPSGAGYVSGSGTEDDPYIMNCAGGNLTLTLSGSKATTDANSRLEYKSGSNAWNTTTTRTVSAASATTTPASLTLKMRCYNTSASLSGTESSKTIWYKKESSGSVSVSVTPAAGGSASRTPTTMGYYSGGTITASANTGYDFTRWDVTTGSGTIGSATTASTTFKPSSSSANVRATFTAKTITVTLDGNEGSGGTATVKYNASSLSSKTDASRAGYSLNGYYTASSGGEKVINADGSLNNVSGWVSGGYWIKATNGTLYAQWTENIVNYTVTYAVHESGHGSLSAANTSTSAAISSGSSVVNGTGVTFTASPSTGYTVDGWFSNAACTTPIAGAGTGNTYSTTISAATSVYVKFKEKTWSVAFAAGTGGTVTTPNSTPRTVGQLTGISIAATPSTGYTFNTWTITSGSGSFTSEATTNSNTFKPTAASTVTASFTETMRTITINGGTAASTTAGVATTGSATAATPAAGKKFTGWTLGSGVTLSGGALTDRTINFTATANSSVTANYADRAQVKMYFAKPTSLSWSKVYAYAWQSSNGSNNNKAYPGVELENTETINCVVYYTYQYYTEGDGIGGAATGQSTWDRIVFGDNNDSRKTGDLTISNGHYYYRASSGTGKAAAITSAWGVRTSKDSFSGINYITHNCATNSGTVDISFTGGNNYNFKLYNEVNDQWWSNSTAMGSSSPVTASMAAAQTMYSNDANNMQLNAALTGSYTFTVGSTNASNPTLKVTFPEIYAIVGSFNSWNSETNPLSMAGNTGTASIVLAPSGSNYTLKVVDDGSMYGKNSTTITGTTTVSSMSTSGADINLTADIYPASANPSYGFSYNKSTKALTVTYPAAHTVTYGVGTHAGTTSVTSSISVVSGKKILDTQSITFSKGDTKTGYTWKGWYNNNAGSSSALGTGATYTSSSRAANTSVYACYDLVTYTITYNLNGGSNPVSPAPATSFTIESSAITLPTPTKTGYSFSGWYENADLSTGGVKTTIPAGSTGNKVYYAKWTPITYTIHFNGNGNTSGSMSDQTGVTYDAATTITANAFVKTGYKFAGWGTTQERANAGTIDRTDGAAHGNLASTQGETAQLWAVWTPKQSAITFDYQTSATGYASSGSITNASGLKGTYGAAMTALTGTMPSAQNGYAFTGFYDATSDGTKYYNADGTSAHVWDKDTESGTTLYARWEKAEITGITMSPGTVVENNSTVTVSPTISPTPTGATTVCWRVLYDDGTPLPSQPTFTPSAQGNSVSFTAPEASGMYKVEAKLHTGSSCGGGTLLDTEEASFQVAGSHTVTVAYKYSSTTIAASTSVTGRPLDWSDPITAPSIFGYTFDHWTAGDGITLSENGTSDLGDDESDEETIYIKATYNGTLTANYTPKNIVYFKDNLGWTDPDDENAHIYVNLLQSDYWDNDRGSGNYNRANRNLEMSRVPGTTDIFYYEYNDKTTSNYISFTKESMGNSGDFYQAAPDFAHVVFPSRSLDALGTNKATGLGFYAATPMFVPLATQTPVKKNSDRAAYYNDGYWTKYLPGTGYSLDIYQSDGSSHVKIVAFTSADELMPMKVTTNLEGGHTYKFQLKRDGDVYYGNGGTMTYEDHGQNTAWEFNNSPFSMCTIVTNAAGDYTFNLSFSPNNGGTDNRLRISVDYPVASGDYRLVYTDNSRSGGKPSAIVNKVNDGSAIVSFFVRHNQSPVLRIQQATVANDGTITWNEYPTSGTPINQITGTIASAITSGGTDVYNFNLSMNGSGALSVASVEKYTGNYYIRTDAANSKWDNYRTDPDHLMTYSDYLKSSVDYTHYYTHWVNKDETGRKNVKFVIANDYSPCISDTLARETASGTWTNIADFIEEGGDLKRSANVRFMWDQETNAIARAYVDGAQEEGTHFLELLSSDSKIQNAAGSETLTAVTFSDKGNWIYEANIQAQPNAQIKLKSSWGKDGETDHIIEQYFKGASDDTETLIGGSGSTWYSIRLLYDFKTNRLVAGYVPSGEIDVHTPINADVMFVREAQEDINQLTFGINGDLSDIKTAYGVMRFNKWTINNKHKSTHSPLAPQLSVYERGLYFISFPFRVNLEEVFGFGTYGTHWIIRYYDGADRAKTGYWADNNKGFWKYITNRKGVFLEPDQGYMLALDLDLLGEGSDVWTNTDQVELYFPSYGSMPDIKNSSVTHSLPAHTCNIGPRFEGGDDRRVKDSHWNVMSVPTYVNTNDVAYANTDWINTLTEELELDGPKFLYEWRMNDNQLIPTSATGYTYHAMHAYMVQYYNNVTWTTSVSPSSPVAARRNPDAPKDVEFRLEIQQNDATADQTFIRMSNSDKVTSEFDFNFDLSKEKYKNQPNIYTIVNSIIDGDLSVTETAGNCLPMSDAITYVPVGVTVPSAGEYTFAMPAGTSGVGVKLYDNLTSISTDLSAGFTYTTDLDAGTHDGRFVLEISPIKQVTTGVEEGSDVSGQNGARKVMIDGILYIVKDNKLFDARGVRIE